MSGPNSLSNINAGSTAPPPPSIVPTPTYAVATGTPNNANLAFDPRDIQIDPSKFRIGGFVNEPSSTPAAGGIALGDVDLMTTAAAPQATNLNLDTNVNANEGEPVAVAMDEPKTEQEQAREQREARFMELLHSGKLGTPQNDRPGKRFTLPVEKPNLM
ncbi:hypothetical protein BGZ58_000183 [Dissophora ornata]|nr:hypothetical protein BGZ58_000183 [Dissophora ornata]